VPSPAKKKGKDPVFFKDEFLAVRNPDDGFYLCKAMQNIYIGSRNIKIQWMSNEPHIIPAKDNPQGDIYAPDFYDKTDFETIVTSVELDKVLGKSKRQILPEEELERIKKILQRAKDKAAGKLNLDSLLTEDNPEGLDISLYEGEDQLDEIDRRRKGDDAASPAAAGKSASAQDSKPKRKAKKASDEDTDFKKEIKIKVKQPKKPVADDEDAEPPRRRVEKRKSAENAKNAMDAFEFADSSEGEEEEEVMPKPKKRKSATAAVEKKTPSKTNETKVQKETEELSTTEKAILEAQDDTEKEEKKDAKEVKTDAKDEKTNTKDEKTNTKDEIKDTKEENKDTKVEIKEASAPAEEKRRGRPSRK